MVFFDETSEIPQTKKLHKYGYVNSWCHRFGFRTSYVSATTYHQNQRWLIIGGTLAIDQLTMLWECSTENICKCGTLKTSAATQNVRKYSHNGPGRLSNPVGVPQDKKVWSWIIVIDSCPVSEAEGSSYNKISERIETANIGSLTYVITLIFDRRLPLDCRSAYHISDRPKFHLAHSRLVSIFWQ